MSLYPTPKPKPTRNPSALLSGVIALALLCCGGGLVAAFNDDRKPQPGQPAASASVQRAAEIPPPAPIPTPAVEPEPAVATATAGSPTATPSPTRNIKPTKSPTPKRTTPAPKTTKPKPKATTEYVAKGVHPGSFCSRQGARGVTKTGKPMVCTTTATDSRKRWRAA
ncbi:hypothetical protein ABZ738_31475 [Micromonospora sp. NPDC047793]|uniref:hypothetical protein n=1 Tax=Micromonospora sp. NPDC047793 TaxID=3154342 RepID=UPI00340A4C3C